MSIQLIAKWGIVAYVISSLIPLSESDHWLIRIWDFPRLQLLVMSLILSAVVIFGRRQKLRSKVFLLLFLSVGAGLDLYRMLPYSVFWPTESVTSSPKDKLQTVSIITFNVLQKNEDSDRLLELVQKLSPDVLLLLEVNDRWMREVASLEKTYPYRISRPLENTYGLALYSKLELEGAQIRELVEKEIPSVYSVIKLRSGRKFEFYGLHPRPPHYKTEQTTTRDAELIQVAKTVSGSKLPVIVTGDLNDVAWSHTTRLFRRTSKLLDPRVGRGIYPTFPTTLPILRFPLDYVFYSDDFTIVSVDRLPDIGSDHYPMYIELNLDPAKKVLQEGPPQQEGDEEEAVETIQKVQRE